MIASATLYEFTNATEECFVRQSPLYEAMRFFIWSAGCVWHADIHAPALEHRDMTLLSWNGPTAHEGLLGHLYGRNVFPLYHCTASVLLCIFALLPHQPVN